MSMVSYNALSVQLHRCWLVGCTSSPSVVSSLPTPAIVVDCNCARRRVPESEQTAFVMITDLLWLNRQLKYNKENKTIRLIIIENMYNIYKD